MVIIILNNEPVLGFAVMQGRLMQPQTDKIQTQSWLIVGGGNHRPLGWGGAYYKHVPIYVIECWNLYYCASV